METLVLGFIFQCVRGVHPTLSFTDKSLLVTGKYRGDCGLSQKPRLVKNVVFIRASSNCDTQLYKNLGFQLENYTRMNEKDLKPPARYDSLQKEKHLKTFKIVVIGEPNVGKTCLSFRFCGGKFQDQTESTIGVDFRERKLNVRGEDVVLQLWDTAGQERFRHSMIPHFYRNANAVVFVYDITTPTSFENLPIWIDECNKYIPCSTMPRILIGNKCDSKDSNCVPTGDAQKFADHHGMPLFETSAKDDTDCDHVESIFLTLALRLQAFKSMMISDPSNLGIEDQQQSIKLEARNQETIQTNAFILCC